MGWKEFREEHKRQVAEAMEKDRKKQEEKLRNKPSEQEKFYKTANTVSKGIALWLMLPIIGVLFIILVFVGFWLWDLFIGLFS